MVQAKSACRAHRQSDIHDARRHGVVGVRRWQEERGPRFDLEGKTEDLAQVTTPMDSITARPAGSTGTRMTGSATKPSWTDVKVRSQPHAT
jgi:hypothetical protein